MIKKKREELVEIKQHYVSGTEKIGKKKVKFMIRLNSDDFPLYTLEQKGYQV